MTKIDAMRQCNSVRGGVKETAGYTRMRDSRMTDEKSMGEVKQRTEEESNAIVSESEYHKQYGNHARIEI